MKKLNIQLKNDSLLKLESNFLLLNSNKQLIKNQSNKSRISCMNSFSGLKAGIILYVLYVSLFIIGIIGATNIGRVSIQYINGFRFERDATWPVVMTALGFALFGIVFFISLIRILSSTITISLKEFGKSQQDKYQNQPLDQYIKGLIESSIELSVKCECYHESTSTTTNSDGSTSTSTTTHVTYTEDINIPIIECKDLSNPLYTNEIDNLKNKSKRRRRNFINISFYNYYMPSDQDSQTIIKQTVDYLTEKNQHKDTSFRIQLVTNYIDKKFKEHLLFSINSINTSSSGNNLNNNIYDIEKGPTEGMGVDGSDGDHSNGFDKPFLFKYGFYILSLFLFMFLPYEIYFNSKVYKSKFTFIKSIKVAQVILPMEEEQSIIIPIQGQNTNYQPFYDDSSYNNYQQQSTTVSLDKDTTITTTKTTTSIDYN